jgi:hypothetical protein
VEPSAISPDIDAANTVRSVAIPSPGRLLFAVVSASGGRTEQGKGELSWRHDGTSYEAVLRSDSAEAVTILRSSGNLDATGLRPRAFAATRQLRAGSKASSAAELATQDVLAAVLQLSAILAGAGAAQSQGKAITIELERPAESSWTFLMNQPESLSIEGNPVEALKVTTPEGAEPRLEVWVAPRLDYAPVRIHFTAHDGTSLAFQLSGHAP